MFDALKRWWHADDPPEASQAISTPVHRMGTHKDVIVVDDPGPSTADEVLKATQAWHDIVEARSAEQLKQAITSFEATSAPVVQPPKPMAVVSATREIPKERLEEIAKQLAEHPAPPLLPVPEGVRVDQVAVKPGTMFFDPAGVTFANATKTISFSYPDMDVKEHEWTTNDSGATSVTVSFGSPMWSEVRQGPASTQAVERRKARRYRYEDGWVLDEDFNTSVRRTGRRANSGTS